MEHPWRHVNSPLELAHSNPCFLVCELMFLAVGAFVVYRALRTAGALLFLLVAVVVTGVSCDLFFMLLPVVSTFWHAQALLMVTERLPLYVVAVYVCFLLLPTVAARAFVERCVFSCDLQRRLCLASLAGLAGSCIVTLIDAVGVRFLFYTWHDTDSSIAERAVDDCSPYSSATFGIVFTAAFALLTDCSLPASDDHDDDVATSTTLARIWPVVLCTPAMMMGMGFLQVIEPTRASGFVSFMTAAVVAVSALVYALLQRQRQPKKMGQATLWPLLCVVAVVSTLTLVALVGDPSRAVSVGLHQTIGDCGAWETDIAGNKRQRFLCASNFSENYYRIVTPQESRGASSSSSSSSWYAIQGTPHIDKAAYLLHVAVRAVGAVGLCGMYLAA